MKQSRRVSSYRKTNQTSATSKRGHKLTPRQRKRFSKKGGGIMKGFWS